MPFKKWCVISWSISALASAGCAHLPTQAAMQAKDAREIRALLARPTPETLTIASILEPWTNAEGYADLSMKYIEQAEALAPRRPELVSIELAQCRRLMCADEKRIEDHLKELDPENGFVWLPELVSAQASGSQPEITAAIVRISRSSKMTFYWNELEVLLADGMAVAEPSVGLSDRGVYAIGLASALAIPPLQPMSKACRPDQFEAPGRRAACEALFMQMEHSSSVLTQSLALSVQNRWWPAGTAQHAVLQEKRRRLDYLMTMSSRIRWWRPNRDMALRLEAARQTEREEDVELAVIKSFGLPADPPASWKDSLNAG